MLGNVACACISGNPIPCGFHSDTRRTSRLALYKKNINFIAEQQAEYRNVTRIGENSLVATMRRLSFQNNTRRHIVESAIRNVDSATRAREASLDQPNGCCRRFTA